MTNEGSVPEMDIWSILLIKSDLKWCIHLSRNIRILLLRCIHHFKSDLISNMDQSLFSYFNYLVSVTAGGPKSP